MTHPGASGSRTTEPPPEPLASKRLCCMAASLPGIVVNIRGGASGTGSHRSRTALSRMRGGDHFVGPGRRRSLARPAEPDQGDVVLLAAAGGELLHHLDHLLAQLPRG